MEYKEYFGKVEFGDEANIFYGEVINLRDVVPFKVKQLQNYAKLFVTLLTIILIFVHLAAKNLKSHILVNSLYVSILNFIKPFLSKQKRLEKASMHGSLIIYPKYFKKTHKHHN